MNKVIVMSIRPKWLAKIASGEKTIEIRKGVPDCELPIDVYLYCTKGKKYLHHDYMFLTDNDRLFLSGKIELPNGFILNGKVVAKFTLNKVDQVVYIGRAYTVGNNEARTNDVARKSCLDFKDLHTYLDGKNGYAWHIDDLIVLNKPMEVNEFYKIKYRTEFEERYIPIKQAPQSWQYAYVKDKKI